MSLFLGLFLACNSEKEEDTSAASETQEASSEDGPSVEPDGVSPVVAEADFFCKVEASGVEVWMFQSTVEDPQGNDTLESFQPEAGSFLSAAGGMVSVIAIVCNPEGLCTAANTADTLGIGCAQAEQYKFEFSIADEDGNQSESQTLDGRFEGEPPPDTGGGGGSGSGSGSGSATAETDGSLPWQQDQADGLNGWSSVPKQ